MTIEAEQASAAMTDVLSALATELALAQGQCARLDGALGQLLQTASTSDRPAVMRELHVVDLLSQQIGAVASFVDRLAGGVAEDQRVAVAEALDAIMLGEVAERIRLGVGQPPTVSAGFPEDLELF